MNDILNQKALLIDFDSTFVKVETLDELAKLSLENDPDAEDKIEMISRITHQAMSGEISFPAALEKRLGILSLSKDDIKQITADISSRVSDSFMENKEFIQSNFDSIWILFGFNVGYIWKSNTPIL